MNFVDFNINTHPAICGVTSSLMPKIINRSKSMQYIFTNKHFWNYLRSDIFRFQKVLYICPFFLHHRHLSMTNS